MYYEIVASTYESEEEIKNNTISTFLVFGYIEKTDTSKQINYDKIDSVYSITVSFDKFDEYGNFKIINKLNIKKMAKDKGVKLINYVTSFMMHSQMYDAIRIKCPHNLVKEIEK